MEIEQLIQVTYASSEEEIEIREKKALVKASEELNCDDLRVITWDYESEEEFKGRRIKFIPLWKWLLKEEGYLCYDPEDIRKFTDILDIFLIKHSDIFIYPKS